MGEAGKAHTVMDERSVLDDVLKLLRKLEGDEYTDEMYSRATSNAVALIEGLRRKYNTGSPCDFRIGHCVTCGSMDKAGCWFASLDSE
jgi:hypothetical protein